MVIESEDPETGTITIRRWAITLEVWREEFERLIYGGRLRREAVWPILAGTYRSYFEYETAEAAVVACQICERRQARQEFPDDPDDGRQFFFVSKLRYDRVVVDEDELGP